MIRIRRSQERGHFDHGWLDTYHTFSFGDYFDREQMGFRSLRVLNEDWIRGGQGFGSHPHRDMEIVTYVLDGALRHRDSLGHGGIVRAGELQRMTAGTGIVHSEFNASAVEDVHLVQIWIVPERRGLEPGYEQTAIDPAEVRGVWKRLAAPAGDGGAVTIRQDAQLSLSSLDAGQALRYDLDERRHAWVQVLRGAVTLNGEPLAAGDGAAVSDLGPLDFAATVSSEVLLFDLA